jgi:hypothetical protein
MWRGGRGRGNLYRNNPRQYYAIKNAQKKKQIKQQADQDEYGDGDNYDEEAYDGNQADRGFRETENADIRPPGSKRRKIGPTEDEMDVDDGMYHDGADLDAAEEIRFAPTAQNGAGRAVSLQLASADRFSASPKTANLVDVYRTVPGATLGSCRSSIFSALAFSASWVQVPTHRPPIFEKMRFESSFRRVHVGCLFFNFPRVAALNSLFFVWCRLFLFISWLSVFHNFSRIFACPESQNTAALVIFEICLSPRIWPVY